MSERLADDYRRQSEIQILIRKEILRVAQNLPKCKPLSCKEFIQVQTTYTVRKINEGSKVFGNSSSREEICGDYQ